MFTKKNRDGISIDYTFYSTHHLYSKHMKYINKYISFCYSVHMLISLSTVCYSCQLSIVESELSNETLSAVCCDHQLSIVSIIYCDYQLSVMTCSCLVMAQESNETGTAVFVAHSSLL